MSLRTRLLVFFVAIVMIPTLALAAVVLGRVRDTERGEVAARLEVAESAARERGVRTARRARTASRSPARRAPASSASRPMSPPARAARCW
jgi:sensor histidine kinase regulating citrate/malate metabolism